MVDPQDIIAKYNSFAALDTGGAEHITKPGVRGYPGLPAGIALLRTRADIGGERLLDATLTGGVLANEARERGHKGGVAVAEPSMAALRCAQRALDGRDVELSAGTSWYVPRQSFEHIYLAPATDRGTARVEAELVGAHAALAAGGNADIVMHKDQGAKRYERFAKELFGHGEIVAKERGWRLVRLAKRIDEQHTVKPIEFEAAGLQLAAEPGVFAAGKLDPGTKLLLDTLDLGQLAGRRVLDLGCGYGILALKVSLAGAEVTALDDDLTAVRSTYANAMRYGLDVRCLHSDLDSALKQDESFDVVLTNPPFHVARQVQLPVSLAFLAVALKHLRQGGVMVLVANQALGYERYLAAWGDTSLLAAERGFKVLSVVNCRGPQ